MDNPSIRIVSLVPSLSELVAYFDLDALVGRTRFCVFPTDIILVPQIGGTKNINLQKIRNLKPDLIIASREENIREQVEEIESEFPTKVFDIQTVEDALDAIKLIGSRMNKEEAAIAIINQIRQERELYSSPVLGTAIYLIWQKPWMTVGGDTYINTMMNEAGFTNLFSSSRRYPIIPDESVFTSLCPDYLLLSSEPYPFKDRDILYFQSLIPQTKVLWVDGTFFSWYGSRLAGFYTYMVEKLKV